VGRQSQLVTDHLGDALTEEEAAQFERHLRSCDGCERYVEQMRLTIDAVGRVTAEDLPADTRQRLLGEFRRWRR
jgi:anti-sigma factor RsiW